MNISDFKELKVWQKSIDLTLAVYELIDLLPSIERFSLADQMRRSVVSVPSNIAEGQARQSIGDFIRFLLIARGSLAEIQTQIIICIKRGYFSEMQSNIAISLIDEVGRMSNRLIYSLSNK